MKLILYILRFTIGAAAALVFFLSAGTALAATLSISSGSSQVTVGDIVTVRVSVNAGGQAINTAEGTLQFPTDVLQALTLNKSSSIFSIWVEDPSFSNQSGEVTFSGGLPSPGYSGSNGTVLTVSFRVKRSGTATLSLSDATVRANDGLGTDVLSGTGSLQLTAVNPPAVTPPPTVQPTTPQTPTPKLTTPAPADTTPTTTPLFRVPATPTPVLDLLPSHMDRGDQLTIQGQASPQDAHIYIYVSKDGNAPIELNATPSTSGAFSAIGPILQNGTYEVWAEGVSDKDVLSEPTDKMSVQVGDQSLIALGPISLTLASLLLLAIAVSLAALIAAIVGWYKVYQYHKGRHSEVVKIQKSVHRAFAEFKDGIQKHVDALDDANTKRDLTAAESKLKADMRSNVSNLEKYIDDILT